MKIVIDIDEDEYKARQRWVANPRALINAVDKAIANGIPLPKGHGRLCDMDAALECLQETADCKIKQYAVGMLDWAMSKRTIIKADEEDDTDDRKRL